MVAVRFLIEGVSQRLSVVGRDNGVSSCGRPSSGDPDPIPRRLRPTPQSTPAPFPDPSLTPTLSNVSAYGTNQRDYLREDFWFIAVTEGNEDETEIADTSDRWGQGDQGHPPGNTQAILGRRKDPHCP